MHKPGFIIVLFLVLLPLLGEAQRLYPQSLGIGLRSGAASVPPFESNTAAFSLSLDHQANISDFFSWRTALRGIYLLPIQYQVVTVSSTLIQEIDIQDYEHGHINLTTMPVIYHREKRFNVFAGFGGGIGVLLQERELFQGDRSGNIRQKKSQFNHEFFQVGLTSMIGIGLGLGTDTEQEVEISLSGDSWWNTGIRGNGDWNSWLGLNISYRYNFKEQ